MNIVKKIEWIKNQPENIRLRYVWGCVIVSMFIILAVWFFSIVSMFGKTSNVSNQETSATVTDLKQQLQDLKTQAPSLKDINDDLLNTDNAQQKFDSNTGSTQNYTDLQSSPDSTANIPQSNNYSGLQSNVEMIQQ